MTTIQPDNILHFTRQIPPQPKQPTHPAVTSPQQESRRSVPIDSLAMAQAALARFRTALQQNPGQALLANNLVHPQFLRILE